MNDPLPVFYSFRRCPYAMRARLSLLMSQTCVELREVVLRNKPQSMLEASPKGTVPVLILPDGAVIDESLDIMRWALSHNDPHGLWPQGAAHKELRDSMLELIGESDGPFKTHLDRYKYGNRYDNCDPQDHRTQASVFLLNLNARLEHSVYLMGDEMRLADLAIAPFVRQFANTDRAWFDAQNWPHLIKWLTSFLELQSFIAIMAKLPPWQSGDERVVFPFAA